MKIIEIKCPHCNGKLDFDMDKGTCICPYCGSSLYFDNENRTITHVTVVRDEAKIKEAENEAKRIETEKDYKLKMAEVELRKAEMLRKADFSTKMRWVLKLLWFISTFGLFVLIGYDRLPRSLEQLPLYDMIFSVLLGFLLLVTHKRHR